MLSQAPSRGGLRGVRYRHRHPAREAEDHLRGLPAGRRLAPAASTAAPASAWPSAANWRACWAAKSSCAATPGVGSTFALYLPIQYAGSTLTGARRERQGERCGQRRFGKPILLPERAIEAIPDDRHELRRRLDAAHRRGRPALRPRSGRSRARKGLQGRGREYRRARRSNSPSNISRPQYRSTCSCPTCSAGACSASSSRTR